MPRSVDNQSILPTYYTRTPEAAKPSDESVVTKVEKLITPRMVDDQSILPTYYQRVPDQSLFLASVGRAVINALPGLAEGVANVGYNVVSALPGVAKSTVITGANVYAGVLEGSINATIGTLECVGAVTGAACDVWKTGLKKTLENAVDESLGLNDFGKIGETLTTSVVTVKSGPAKGQPVRVPVPKRIGKAVGHAGKGIAKVTRTAAGAGIGTAWAVGSATNLLNIAATPGTILSGAQNIASGINTIAQVSYGAASTIAPYALSVGQVGLSILSKGVALAVNCPAETIQVGGSGLLLYGAAKEVQNAAAAEGRVSQVFHGSMAALLAASAVTVSPLVSSIC